MSFLCKLALSFTVLCFAFAKPLIAEETAVFACNEFPPYKMQNSPSGLPGFDVEFLDEAFKRVGVKLEIQYMPWKRALDAARKGKVDGICSCSKAKERESYILYSEPLGRASSGLFSLAQNNFPKVKELEGIGAKSVGVIRGYNIIENLKSAGITNSFELANEKQGLKMLMMGRIDYYYSYDAPTRYYLSELKQADQVVYDEIAHKDYYSCLSKIPEGAEALLKRFNAGLAEIKSDGTYKAILDKYR